MRVYKRLSHRFLDRHGAMLVEFSVSITVALALLFWVFYASMALYADHFTANAARAATRYAMVRGSTWGGTTCSSAATLECTATTTDVSSYVNTLVTPGLDTGALTVTTTWPGTTPTGAACDTTNGSNSPYCSVTVQVTYNFNLTAPILPHQSLTFSSGATAPITE